MEICVNTITKRYPYAVTKKRGKPENFDAILFHSFFSSNLVDGRMVQLKVKIATLVKIKIWKADTMHMIQGPNQRRRREDQIYVFVSKESPAHDKHREWKKWVNIVLISILVKIVSCIAGPHIFFLVIISLF